MNFTREPIIETIISPKEGYKLLLRNSKGAGGEEYYVDAVEVVCFGKAFFFRCQERPKPFLVPVGDYEVSEVKEARIALKNVSHEKNIKIGGGREASLRHPSRESSQAKESVEATIQAVEPQLAGEVTGEPILSGRIDKRRDRRRHRRRRGGEDQDWSGRRNEGQQEPQAAPMEPVEGGSEGVSEEIRETLPAFTSLIPPPLTLISQTLSRYKEKEVGPGPSLQENPQDEERMPSLEEKHSIDSGEDNAESTPLHRNSVPLSEQNQEDASFSSTFFTSLSRGNDSFFF